MSDYRVLIEVGGKSSSEERKSEDKIRRRVPFLIRGKGGAGVQGEEREATHHSPEAEMGGRRVDQEAIGEGGGVHLGVGTGTYLESPEEAAQGHEMQREGLVALFEEHP